MLRKQKVMESNWLYCMRSNGLLLHIDSFQPKGVKRVRFTYIPSDVAAADKHNLLTAKGVSHEMVDQKSTAMPSCPHISNSQDNKAGLLSLASMSPRE